MKRSLMLSLIILPAIALIALVALNTSATSTRARINNALWNYLHYRAPFSASLELVEQLMPAASPRNFTPQMSRLSFSYRANVNEPRPVTQTIYILPADTRTELISQTAVVTGLVAYISPWPLAFPPADLWCVRLRPDGNFYPTIVFVALHEDDYHREWIVHDPAAETAQQLTGDLATLGCSDIKQP